MPRTAAAVGRRSGAGGGRGRCGPCVLPGAGGARPARAPTFRCAPRGPDTQEAANGAAPGVGLRGSAWSAPRRFVPGDVALWPVQGQIARPVDVAPGCHGCGLAHRSGGGIGGVGDDVGVAVRQFRAALPVAAPLRCTGARCCGVLGRVRVDGRACYVDGGLGAGEVGVDDVDVPMGGVQGGGEVASPAPRPDRQLRDLDSEARDVGSYVVEPSAQVVAIGDGPCEAVPVVAVLVPCRWGPGRWPGSGGCGRRVRGR